MGLLIYCMLFGFPHFMEDIFKLMCNNVGVEAMNSTLFGLVKKETYIAKGTAHGISHHAMRDFTRKPTGKVVFFLVFFLLLHRLVDIFHAFLIRWLVGMI